MLNYTEFIKQTLIQMKKSDIIQVFRTVRDLTLRKFPSKLHKRAWRDFDKILMYRTIMCSLSRVVYTTVQACLGTMKWQESQEYVAMGEPANHELALKMQPYIQAAYVTIVCARVILFLLQLKWHHISKVNFYFELSIFLLD